MAGDDEVDAALSSQNTKTKMFNVLLLGLCFCFVFTGFNTMGQTQVICRKIGSPGITLSSQALVYDSAAETGEIPGFSVDGLVT